MKEIFFRGAERPEKAVTWVSSNFVSCQFLHDIILNVALGQEYAFTPCGSLRVVGSWFLYITRHLRTLLLRMFSFCFRYVPMPDTHYEYI